MLTVAANPVVVVPPPVFVVVAGFVPLPPQPPIAAKAAAVTDKYAQYFKLRITSVDDANQIAMPVAVKYSNFARRSVDDLAMEKRSV